MTTIFKTKIDWWIYLVLIIMVCGCLFGLILEGESAVGIILAGGMAAFWLFAVSGVKYEIHDNQLGIRNFYRWTWLPIDQIKSVEKFHGIHVQGVVSATLSLDIVRMTLSGKNNLQSRMPICISPADRDGFIEKLKEINPKITIA